jgi:hypothetical protein
VLRLPCWVARDGVQCWVDGRLVVPAASGNCLLFSDLKTASAGAAGSVIRIEFPVPAATETHALLGRKYDLTFRGSTLVDISPPDTVPGRYRYYLRGGLRLDKAPMRTVERFVADRAVALQ